MGTAKTDLSLTVYFDGECGLCERVADWLDRQPKYVPLWCVAAQSTVAGPAGGGAAARVGTCPIDAAALLDQLTVTGSDGAIYRGTKAWIMCLWALRNYRGWAMTLSTESMWPMAKRLFGLIVGLANLTKPRRSGS